MCLNGSKMLLGNFIVRFPCSVCFAEGQNEIILCKEKLDIYSPLLLFYFLFLVYNWYTFFFSLYFFFFLFVFPLPSHCFTVVERDVSKKASKNREERRKSEYSRLGEKQHCYLYKHWDTRLLKSCLSFLSVKQIVCQGECYIFD